MDSSERQRQGIQRALISMVFLLIIPIYLTLTEDHPFIAKWLPVGMVVLGIPVLVVALILFGRYREVFDYEPTTLWGRPANGKQVRRILFNISLAGGWLVLIGVFLYFLFGRFL